MGGKLGSRPLLITLVFIAGCGGIKQTGSGNALADLGGTSWQLVEFQSMDDTTLRPAGGARYTIEFGRDGSFTARVDCNRGRGKWTSAGPSELQISELGLTKMACPPGPLNNRIVRDFGFVRTYTMKAGHLYLALMMDGGIYEFAPANAGSAPTRVCPDGARRVVQQLGERMRLVSLLGHDTVAARALADAYAELVTPELLASWQAAPAAAPGRTVSNPWPARIQVHALQQVGDECSVNGDIVYVTSSDTLSVVDHRAVTLRLREQGGWRVTSYQPAPQ